MAATCTQTKHTCAARCPSPDPFLQRPAGMLRVLAFLAQVGAGLAILGTATLTNTNLYENVAFAVSLQSEPASTFPPAPRWNVTWCSPFLQWGGGLRIYGTATLIDSNVYSNQAGVGARFEPS